MVRRCHRNYWSNNPSTGLHSNTIRNSITAVAGNLAEEPIKSSPAIRVFKLPSIAFDDNLPGASGVTATYGIELYDRDLIIGDLIILWLPGWSGTPTSSDTCGNATSFTITGTGDLTSSYKITIRPDGNINKGTNCSINISGLVNPLDVVPENMDTIKHEIVGTGGDIPIEPLAYSEPITGGNCVDMLSFINAKTAASIHAIYEFTYSTNLGGEIILSYQYHI